MSFFFKKFIKFYYNINEKKNAFFTFEINKYGRYLYCSFVFKYQ